MADHGEPGLQTTQHPLCIGCQTVVVRYRITVYDLWNMPLPDGAKRTARRFYCERCWKMLRTNIDASTRLALLREATAR